MDASGVCEPKIVTVVLQKLGMHLKNLKFFRLFDIVAHFEALLAAVLLIPLSL
jgi:hypothetical protein